MTYDARIRRLSSDEIAAAAPTLAAILLDAVMDGASVGFMADLSFEHAEAYWRAAATASDGRAVLIAHDAEGIAGVVVVMPAAEAFQSHRAQIVKMMVHRRARGRGLAKALMQGAEQEARKMDRTVLSLFTRHGSAAERMYEQLGWIRVGIIPDDSLRPDGTLCDGSIFYKRVD